MQNEAEAVLTPLFRALRELREAYAKYSQSDADCYRQQLAAANRRAKGHLLSANVVSQIDRVLGHMDGTQPLMSVDRERLVAKERELIKHVGGDRQHSVARALDIDQLTTAVLHLESTRDMAAYLDRTHQTVVSKLHRNAKLWERKKRRNNKEWLRRADQAILCVGYVVVDVLQENYMPASYRVSAYLATEVGLP